MVEMIGRNYTTGYSEFVVDTVAELDKLPTITSKGKDNLVNVGSCSVGSMTTVTETSEKYILNGEQNKWILFTAASIGTGSGGSVSNNWNIIGT